MCTCVRVRVIVRARVSMYVRGCARVCVRARVCVCVCLCIWLFRTKPAITSHHLATKQNLQLIDSLNNQNPYALL